MDEQTKEQIEVRVVEMVLMDLYKAYNCLPHDLLMAELAAYGLRPLLHLKLSFVRKNKQTTR